MRVLVTTTPLSTHFLPLVPLACALRAAGHEVLVAGQPDVLDAVRSAGLNQVTIGERFHTQDRMLGLLRGDERLIHTYGRPTAEDMAGYPDTWVEHTASMVPRYLDFARAFRPDLLVSDPLDFKSLIVAAVLGVPSVHHRWGVDPLSGPMRRSARDPLKAVCESVGLAGLPDPDVVLDPCPPSLQLPEADPGTPVRHFPYNGNGELPAWLREEWQARGDRRPPDGRRRVVVSMGARTLDLNGVPLMRRVLGAFDGLQGVEALATVEERYREGIGPLPANVRLIEPTPLHFFLDGCSAMVHHGGTGTVTTAAAYGLPQLALPQLADQFANADRLTATGAGLMLDTAAAQDDPAQVRAAVERLLSQPGLAAAAEGLRRETEAMPVTSRVVTDLERLAAGYRGRDRSAHG
ncbi:nucleotide disphospho-sugar-binding domain-containing protein [Streptomyces cyaneofuscatus]|uniref:nucleotide disphospho-sugar-binding domain-containing protein n=1 Tax=Streptomyces cyaneofuscatus TaxID=66883 RepID=UPI0033F866CE